MLYCPLRSPRNCSRRFPGGNSEFEKIPHSIYLIKLSPGNLPQVARAGPPGCASVDAIKDVFGPAIPKRAYHGLDYNGICYGTQRPVGVRLTIALSHEPREDARHASGFCVLGGSSVGALC